MIFPCAEWFIAQKIFPVPCELGVVRGGRAPPLKGALPLLGPCRSQPCLPPVTCPPRVVFSHFQSGLDLPAGPRPSRLHAGRDSASVFGPGMEVPALPTPQYPHAGKDTESHLERGLVPGAHVALEHQPRTGKAQSARPQGLEAGLVPGEAQQRTGKAQLGRPRGLDPGMVPGEGASDVPGRAGKARPQPRPSLELRIGGDDALMAFVARRENAQARGTLGAGMVPEAPSRPAVPGRKHIAPPGNA